MKGKNTKEAQVIFFISNKIFIEGQPKYKDQSTPQGNWERIGLTRPPTYKVWKNKSFTLE